MSSKSLATSQNRENLESGAQSPKKVRSKLKKLFSSSIKGGSVGESYVGSSHNPSQRGRGTADAPQPAVAGTGGASEPKKKPLVWPIAELWDEAFEKLKNDEKDLIQDYQRVLSRDKSLTSVVASSSFLTGLEVPTQLQMQDVLQRKIDDVKSKEWKLKFKGHELAVKQLVEPVTSTIEWAQDYVGQALEASVYGSLAWSGVCLLLPLVLNPGKQEAARVTALEDIASILSLCKMREGLYRRRYEKHDERRNNGEKSSIPASPIQYRESLKNIYVAILKFQATCVCFLSKGTSSRIALDTVGWTKWDDLLNEIKDKETKFREIVLQWKDDRYEDECDAKRERHEENLAKLGAIEEEVGRVREAIEKNRMDGQRDSLLHWLSTVDPSTNYIKARDEHQASTGDWLIVENQEFQHWKEAPNSLLWLNGKAGSGKSSLSSSAIKHLNTSFDSDHYTAIAYYYFSFQDQKKQNTVNMLSSLIVQLCGCRPDSPQPLLDLAKYKDTKTRPNLDTLENTMRATIADFENVYLIIDALDECPVMAQEVLDDGEKREVRERDKLLACLQQMYGWGEANLHLLLTSRKENDIDSKLRPLFNLESAAEINLEVHKDSVNHDIGTFIDGKLATSKMKNWPKDIRKLIRSTLIAKADAMFQYVALQITALLKLDSRPLVEKALLNLPKGLPNTYLRILEGIPSDKKEQALAALTWLVYSVRPLRLSELAAASSIDPKRDPPIIEERVQFTPDAILTILSGLVTTYEDIAWRRTTNGSIIQICVRLCHFSVQEFLTSGQIPPTWAVLDHNSAHSQLAESCLVFHLHASQVRDAIPGSVKKSRDDPLPFPIWDYTAEHWTTHFEKLAQPSARLQDLALKALDPFSIPLFHMTRAQYSSLHYEDCPTITELLPLPLYQCAYLGWPRLLSLLLSKPETQINAITGYYGTALNGAAADGLIPIIKMLLKAGANPFLGNTGFPCVLAAAIGEWDTETTIFLVESIENIFSRCYEVAYFPLAHAVIEGRKEIVKFLVKKGVDVNKSGGVWGSALQAAAYYRLDRKRGLERGLEIVDFLLKNGAEVNAKGGLFGNALQAAVASSHKKVVQLLQDNGALLDPPGAEWDALLVSIKEDYCKVIVMSDVEDAEKTRKRLDRFQRKHGMKPTPEAETETESEFEARLQWDSSSG